MGGPPETRRVSEGDREGLVGQVEGRRRQSGATEGEDRAARDEERVAECAGEGLVGREEGKVNPRKVFRLFILRSQFINESLHINKLLAFIKT